MGEELWRIAIPASASISVATSLSQPQDSTLSCLLHPSRRGCRVAGWISTRATICFSILLPVIIFALTTVTVKNDKTARLLRGCKRRGFTSQHHNASMSLSMEAHQVLV